MDLRQTVRHLPGADDGRSGHTHITVNAFDPLGRGQNNRDRRVVNYQIRHVRNSARDEPAAQQAAIWGSTQDWIFLVLVSSVALLVSTPRARTVADAQTSQS